MEEKKRKSKKKAEAVIENDIFEIETIVSAMQEKKALNIVSLDMRKLGTSISDYFIICNANSTTSVVAISDHIEEMMLEKCGRKVIRLQGRENAFWIILDYSNITIHIFLTEYRNFYRLEDLWADAVITNHSEE